MLIIKFLAYGEKHTGTCVNYDLATKIGFFFVTFYKKFFRAPEKFPVDIANRFAGIVKAMFSKFNGKTMERAFMETRDKAFNNLSRMKFETAEIRNIVPLYWQFQEIEKFKEFVEFKEFEVFKC